MKEMIRVEEAEAIIQAQVRGFGIEQVPFEQAVGRVLAEGIRADRDLPPFNRVAMDGIAIRYEAFAQGNRSFKIKATQAAGDAPVDILSGGECIEIMTGAALPATTDTVIRYEDVMINDKVATVFVEEVKEGQNIHTRGKDRRRQDPVAQANQFVTPALIGIAAAVGATILKVKKLPKLVIISTGDELVAVEENPLPYQIRRSNSYTLSAALHPYGLQADMLHLPDELEETERQLDKCLKTYDVILLSGGISMGKFDYVPQVLEGLAVKKLFQRVQQRPGKPFWFGRHQNGALVFALPGNPVSTFMCFTRYFIPWLEASLGVTPERRLFAVLGSEVVFKPPLQYFLQVTLNVDQIGRICATPLEGNGSGDFANMVEADAFLELPAEKTGFKAGDVYRLWPIKNNR